MTIWALAKPFLPHILIGLGLIGGVWYFSHSRYTAGYEARSAEIESERVKAQAENERNRKTAGEAYRKDNNALTDRVLNIEPSVIRLCVPVPKLPVPEPAGRVPDATEGGRSDLQASENLARPLVQYATDCERTRRQLKALQDWVRAQSR